MLQNEMRMIEIKVSEVFMWNILVETPPLHIAGLWPENIGVNYSSYINLKKNEDVFYSKNKKYMYK